MFYGFACDLVRFSMCRASRSMLGQVFFVRAEGIDGITSGAEVHEGIRDIIPPGAIYSGEHSLVNRSSGLAGGHKGLCEALHGT